MADPISLLSIFSGTQLNDIASAFASGGADLIRQVRAFKASKEAPPAFMAFVDDEYADDDTQLNLIHGLGLLLMGLARDPRFGASEVRKLLAVALGVDEDFVEKVMKPYAEDLDLDDLEYAPRSTATPGGAYSGSSASLSGSGAPPTDGISLTNKDPLEYAPYGDVVDEGVGLPEVGGLAGTVLKGGLSLFKKAAPKMKTKMATLLKSRTGKILALASAGGGMFGLGALSRGADDLDLSNKVNFAFLIKMAAMGQAARALLKRVRLIPGVLELAYPNLTPADFETGDPSVGLATGLSALDAVQNRSMPLAVSPTDAGAYSSFAQAANRNFLKLAGDPSLVERLNRQIDTSLSRLNN